MKKFLINSISFMGFAMLFYIIALLFWAHYMPTVSKTNVNYRIGSYGHLHSRIADIQNYPNNDILFLGSSHAYRGFDTRIFADKGYKTFNLGSSSQSAIQTKILLERYLDHLNPTLVIYDVYPLVTFTENGVEASLDLIANDVNDKHSLAMAWNINHIKTYNTLVYGLFRDQMGLNEDFVEVKEKDKDRYISGGYVEKQLKYYKAGHLDPWKVEIRDNQWEAFQEIKKMLEERNIEILFVYAPMPKAYYNSCTNNSYFDSLMHTQGNYHNFNTSLALNDSLHFFDYHHLNQKGVAHFNEAVLQLIQEK